MFYFKKIDIFIVSLNSNKYPKEKNIFSFNQILLFKFCWLLTKNLKYQLKDDRKFLKFVDFFFLQEYFFKYAKRSKQTISIHK